MRGAGRAMFAAILLVVAGVLNVIYGIAAIDGGDFYGEGQVFVFADLSTWGWFTLILGIIQLTGGFSLAGGRPYGLVVGITGATLGAIVSLMNIAGAHPFWSLGVFAICLIVLHGLVVFGEDLSNEPRYSTEPR
jgi:hypothetical protein